MRQGQAGHQRFNQQDYRSKTSINAPVGTAVSGTTAASSMRRLTAYDNKSRCSMLYLVLGQGGKPSSHDLGQAPPQTGNIRQVEHGYSPRPTRALKSPKRSRL